MQARRSVAVYAAARPLWQPGGTAPAHLDGTLPGDYGFDPLNLGANEKALDWYRNAELQNGRWAMLGTAGILIPNLISKLGLYSFPEWYDAGKVVQETSSIPYPTLIMVQLFLFNFSEIKRLEDMKKPGSQGQAGSFLGFEGNFKGTGISGYPGGAFDPLKLSTSGIGGNLDELKLKEIKNARLAMVAFLGFAAQHAATGKGPIDDLVDHIASPWGVNFTTNGVSIPVTIF